MAPRELEGAQSQEWQSQDAIEFLAEGDHFPVMHRYPTIVVALRDLGDLSGRDPCLTSGIEFVLIRYEALVSDHERSWDRFSPSAQDDALFVCESLGALASFARDDLLLVPGSFSVFLFASRSIDRKSSLRRQEAIHPPCHGFPHPSHGTRTVVVGLRQVRGTLKGYGG
jgi:hypothetical protein